MFQLVQEFKVQFEHSFPSLSPGPAYSCCFCGAGFMVLSQSERALCVHDVCVGTDGAFPSNQCGGGGK